MLVIHVDSKSDTSFLKELYEGLDCKVLYNPSKSEVKSALKTESGRIIITGHGDPQGLYNERWDGRVIDSSMVNLLRNKEIIGIWCYASEFANRYDLMGFFTSMFISNVEEYVYCGFDLLPTTEEDINRENYKFAKQINDFIKNDIPISIWVEKLQNNCSDLNFVKYNYEALYYESKTNSERS